MRSGSPPSGINLLAGRKLYRQWGNRPLSTPFSTPCSGIRDSSSATGLSGTSGTACTAQGGCPGRYETINWWTKNDDYTWNLDPIRVPAKYPGKRHFKGPNIGKLSGNPKGKNPSDVWAFPNVKNNHPEKTIHPCQFPVELVERLVLSMTNAEDAVFDPYMGVGSSVIGALMHDRSAYGCDIVPEYVDIARQRVHQLRSGDLRTRPMGKPIYDPAKPNGGH